MKTTLACPACTAPDLEQVSKYEFQCSYCRSIVSGKPFICPACGWINTEEAEVCKDCSEPLNVVSQVLSRQDQEGAPQWLRRVRAQASGIKTEEEEASRKRLEVLEEIDRRRKETEHFRFELRKQRDKKILIAVVGIFVIVFTFLTVLFFIQG